ncbi:MAG: helix-turn-helix domain-containing protein [Acidobacteriota bacterium]|nr:helix-turn-helix domain-containing protein [Acidobacteriota bacterium]
MTYYSPKQVAKAIGVSEASLKRWCDRGLLSFVRTAGGHRRIPQQEVLHFVRTNRHDLVAPEILGLPAGTHKPQQSTVKLERIIDILVRGDEKALKSVMVDHYLSGSPLYPIWDTVVGPAFHQLGLLWEQGEIEIYQERLACEICVRVLHEILDILREPTADAPPALGASLSEDPYALPTLMVEITMREMGWRCRSLGTNLPGSTLARAVYDNRPKLMWLSISSVLDNERFIADCDLIWEACNQVGTLLALGGRGLTPELRGAVNYTVFCDRLGDLVNFLDSVG